MWLLNYTPKLPCSSKNLSEVNRLCKLSEVVFLIKLNCTDQKVVGNMKCSTGFRKRYEIRYFKLSINQATKWKLQMIENTVEQSKYLRKVHMK